MNKDFVFGIRPVIEALTSGKDIDKILLQSNLKNDIIGELLDKAHSLNIPVQRVPVEKLNRTTRKIHQGVICFLSPVSFGSLDQVISDVYSAGKDPFILVLDRVSDVRNFGAIVRTAECAGVDTILIPEKGSAAVNADAMKTSAGALHHMSICRVKDLKTGLQFLRESGLRIIGMTEKTSSTLFEANMSGPVAILMGSEEDGISPENLRICDDLVSIPIHGKINSLNVSVSAAIALYEVIRTRGVNN